MSYREPNAVGVDGRDDHSDLLEELRYRSRIVDLVLIALVPVLLVSVYRLPMSAKLSLSLHYVDPTPMAVFASHYIHFTEGHLLSNVLGYIVIVPFTYVLAILARRRREFLLTFATFLFVFPIVISGLNIIIERPRIGYGFSGIAMAFLGYLAVVLADFVSSQLVVDVRDDHSPVLFFIVIGFIALWAVPVTPASLFAASMAGVGGVISSRRLLSDLGSISLRGIRTVAGRTGFFEIAVIGVYLFLLFPFAAFPRHPVGDGRILNIYTHLLGFCLGYLVPYLSFRLLPEIDDRVNSPEPSVSTD